MPHACGTTITAFFDSRCSFSGGHQVVHTSLDRHGTVLIFLYVPLMCMSVHFLEIKYQSINQSCDYLLPLSRRDDHGNGFCRNTTRLIRNKYQFQIIRQYVSYVTDHETQHICQLICAKMLIS